MDLGAINHITNNRSCFDTCNKFQEVLPVRIKDGKRIFAEGSGNINIVALNKWKKKHLSNVLYVPKLTYNFFSLRAVLDKRMTY